MKEKDIVMRVKEAKRLGVIEKVIEKQRLAKKLLLFSLSQKGR